MQWSCSPVTCAWFSKNFGTLSWHKNYNVIVIKTKKKSNTIFFVYNLGHIKDVNDVQNLYCASFGFKILPSIRFIWILHAFWLVLSCNCLRTAMHHKMMWSAGENLPTKFCKKGWWNYKETINEIQQFSFAVLLHDTVWSVRGQTHTLGDITINNFCFFIEKNK